MIKTYLCESQHHWGWRQYHPASPDMGGEPHLDWSHLSLKKNKQENHAVESQHPIAWFHPILSTSYNSCLIINMNVFTWWHCCSNSKDLNQAMEGFTKLSSLNWVHLFWNKIGIKNYSSEISERLNVFPKLSQVKEYLSFWLVARFKASVASRSDKSTWAMPYLFPVVLAWRKGWGHSQTHERSWPGRPDGPGCH